MRLQGATLEIKLDSDPWFTSSFWRVFSVVMGTKSMYSTAFPQTDGQSKRTIQILKDLLMACMFDFGGNCEVRLPLVEFTNNNSYQVSIGMAPFEVLYGRLCRCPMCWV